MEGFIKIYRVVNGTTEELKEVTLSKRSYWHHELGGIDYVMLFFSLDSDNLAVTTPFKEGDFIINPINGDKYFIMDLAVPNENNSGFWDFQLRFDNIVTSLSRNICKYTLQGGNPELSWKLTDSMSGNSVLKQAILASIARDDFSQSGQWRIDTETYVQDIDFTQQFTYAVNGEKYTELFDKICENYGCEWWNEKVGNDNVIYFGIAIKGSFVEFVDAETNALAHQLQIISTSTQKSSEEYATRLYYRGSERNVPRNYNLTTGVKRDPVSYLNDSRLPLPDNTPYIESSAIAGSPHAGIELYEVNDSIYPRRIEHVTKVLYYKGLDDDGNEQRFYCVLTDNPVASIEGFKVDSSKGNLSISFSSGSLNGRTFEVQLHKEALNRANLYNLDGTQYQGSTAGTWYEIVAEGSGDSSVPNTYLHPSASNGGDECQLFNWIAYDTETKVLTQPMLALIAQARQELYAAAQQRFLEISVLNTSFTCVPAKVGTPSSLLLSIGQAVRVNTAPVLVGASFSSRIRAVEVLLYNTNDRTYTVGIGSKYSRLGSILNSLRQNREDLLTLEDTVNSQPNPTVFQIREKNNIAIVRKKQDNSHVPDTLSFDVFSVTGRTETKCTDRYVIRVKYDSGPWLSPDSEGNFDISSDFLVCTAAAFTDTTLEVQVAATTILMLEDGSRAAGLTITNPLQIIEVDEDWDVGYAFADNTDAYETDIYSFSKGGNLPILDIDIFLEAVNGTQVPIVVDGVSVGTTSINGSPIRVVFSSVDNRASLRIEFTSSSVQSLFTIPVLVSMKVSVDGATSELAQTATIVFRQRGVDGTDGTDGSAASVRKLIVSPDYIVSDAEGNLLSRQITFSGQIVVGDGLPSALPDVKFKAIIDGNAVSGNITSPYTLPVSCQTVVIEMYDESGLTLLDSQSIPIVKQGRVGKDAVTVILSNENHTLSLEDDRDVINYSGSGTSVKLVTAEYEFIPKDYTAYPENERWQHLQPGEFFVHATGTDITVGARSILGNSFSFGNASNLVGGTTGDRAAYIDFTIYFRAIGETQINYVTKRQNFSVAPSGFNVAIITLYKRSAEELAANDFIAACAAATPNPITAIRYNFITKAFSTLPAGWTSIVPSTAEAALWAVQATARSRTDEDTIAVTEFSSPTKVLPSGINQAITAKSSRNASLLTNSEAVIVTDGSGIHTIYNEANSLNLETSDSNGDGIFDVGLVVLIELNGSTLREVKRHSIILSRNSSLVYSFREYTKQGSSQTSQSLSAFVSNVSSSNFVTFSAFGDVSKIFDVVTSARDNFEVLGIARFAFDNSNFVFAAIGKKNIVQGTAVLDVASTSAIATVFVENGNFANNATQLHSETITLYRRLSEEDMASAILNNTGLHPAGTVRFSFLSHRIISGTLSPWSQDFPESNDTEYMQIPCWVIHATAVSASDTDDILSTEWSEPERFVQDGEHGFNTAIVSLYIRSSSEVTRRMFLDACISAVPGVSSESDANAFLTYNFENKTLSYLPTGWSLLPQDVDNQALWVVQATAAAKAADDTIRFTEFSSPVRSLPSGANTAVTAVSTTTWNRTTNAVAAVLLDSNGQHKIYNRFNESGHQASSSAVGAIKLLELNSTTLAKIRELTIPIQSSVQQQLPDSFFDNIASTSIIVVSCYGNVTTVFEKYIGNSSYDSFEKNLASIGCPRFRLKSGETFALVGSRSITAGSAILTINSSSAEASAFVKNGVFVNGLSQIKSETVTLFGRFANATAASNALPTSKLEYSFVTHSLTSVPTGWSQTFPDATSTVLPCFMIQATASGANEIDVIESSEWSAPVVYVRNGISISSADIVFYAQQSGSTAPADDVSWKTTFAALNLSSSISEYYVWQATKVTYADNTIEYTGKICLGQGKDFASVTEQYALGTASAATGTWVDNTPPAAQKGSYLWTRTKLTYTGQTEAYYLPSSAGICIGYFGTDGDIGPTGPTGPTGPQGPRGEQGFSFRKINTSSRRYTLSQWHTYGDPGHSESWGISGYDNSHIVVGDTVYLVGKVSDCKDAAGNEVDVMSFGTCTAISSSIITMYTTNLIIGGTKGDKGDNGGRGPALRGPQDWNALPTSYYFYQGADGETYKDLVLYNGNFYSCIKTHNKRSGVLPTDTSYWAAADKVEIIASNILLSTYALIQNLGASAIEMKDPSTGQTLFYAKDGTVSCKVGIFENVTVSGTVNGVTGSFKWLDCVDSSGNVVGRICPSTGSYGGVAFESVDFIQQGTKDSRSLRFYSADIWCRGGFGAHHLNVAVVSGSTIKYYTKGPTSSTYESKTMTSHYGDGKTYYDIELYSGMSGDVSGFPVDLVIINHTYDGYAYRLVGGTGKKVTVICSNDYHGAYIAYIAGWLEMSGGEARPFAYVGTHYSPSTSNVGAGWFALEGCDNTWV